MTQKRQIFSLIFATVFLCLPFLLTAQITPEMIAKMKSVNTALLSPDGQNVAYTVIQPADPFKENTFSQAHLFVMNLATKTIRPFFTQASASQVAFRPIKGTITFLARIGDDKTNALYEMDLTGGEARKIFEFSANIASYTWSEDGNKIVFVSVEKGSRPKTSLTFTPTFFEEEMSQRNAYIVDFASLSTSKPEQIDLQGGHAYLVAWSHDGKKIAISTAPTSSVDDSYMKQGIKIVSASSKTILAGIENKGKLESFVWSPDDQAIAILGAYDLNDPTNGTISIVTSHDRIPKVIDGDFKGKYESIHWAEDGFIYYSASEGTAKSIGRISADGRLGKNIFKSQDHNIGTVAFGANGKIVFVANTPTFPSELFELENGNPQRLTNSNPWLTGLKMGKQEVVTYTTRDGAFEIQGILIYPVDYQEATRVPLITVVHGGPESHYSNGWLTAYSMPGQMAAAKGYAVFYPNYRGSTGRGVEFTYSSQNDPAGKEFDDIVDGVDYLIKMGLVDKDRVGVTGGSYGGYASAWMSTYYSDRFAASVMFVGISNTISKFGTSDIPNEMYLVHERKQLWDEWEKQLKRSPIYYVDRTSTPTLIMHGADDPRVHPTQSMELYRHIKVRKPDVPVRLIYYPGEGHGNGRSGSRYDYNIRMMEWFDTYLMTGNRKAPLPSLDLKNN